MVTDDEYMVKSAFTGEIAQGNAVLFLERTLRGPGCEVFEAKDEVAALGHVPQELRLLKLKVKLLNDSLLDVVLDSILQVPLPRVRLHDYCQINDFRGQTKQVVNVKREMTLFKDCADVANCRLVAARGRESVC